MPELYSLLLRWATQFAKKLLRLTLSGARLTVSEILFFTLFLSERLVGNRVAPISGIKGSDSGGGPAPRHSIIYTAPFSSFHFFGSFFAETDRKVNFCKGLSALRCQSSVFR